jgi:hypothetical protein
VVDVIGALGQDYLAIRTGTFINARNFTDPDIAKPARRPLVSFPKDESKAAHF